MARQMLMSWVPARKRWTKKYQGKMYVVSCKALSTPETKDASWRAANAWWVRKQAELDAESTAADAPNLRLASALATLAAIEAYDQTGVLPRTVQVEGYGLPPTQITLPADLQARGEAQAAPVLAALDGMTARMPTEATVGGRAQEWYGVLRDGKKVPRFASYRRNLEVFLDQVGRSSPLESIGSRTLEGWHGTLSVRVKDGAYSPDYARSLFGCSRKFLKWLAGHKLIELPSNFDDTDFRFEPGNRVTADRLFTNQEVSTILEAASTRMRLFLLLMLNCGFYQSDVSDLTEDEVDWERGVITRGRSKTRQKGVVVTYKLWTETFDLLRACRNVGAPVLDGDGRLRVLVTAEGKPLQAYWIEGGKERRYDSVQSLWSTLKRQTGVDKALKDLRKTSANRLGRHKEYRSFVQHFLAQSARSVANEFYLVAPPDEDFFPALEWLGREFGLGNPA
jgi:integrase